jgi:hypothetical protein
MQTQRKWFLVAPKFAVAISAFYLLPALLLAVILPWFHGVNPQIDLYW